MRTSLLILQCQYIGAVRKTFFESKLTESFIRLSGSITNAVTKSFIVNF